MANRSGISKPTYRGTTSTLRRSGLVSSEQTSSEAGLRAPRLRIRYCRVRPESMMSSTIRTSRPSIGISRSLRIRPTPLVGVFRGRVAACGVCLRAVAGDRHEVDLDGDLDVAHEVGEEEHRALEHA